METRMVSGNCQVISSEEVMSFGGAPIDITLLEQNSSAFHIIFEFISDKSTKECKLLAEPQSDGVKLLLTNFGGTFGAGTKKPINFASQSGKKLYINFYVHTVGESNPILHYTIYKEI